MLENKKVWKWLENIEEHVQCTRIKNKWVGLCNLVLPNIEGKYDWKILLCITKTWKFQAWPEPKTLVF